MFDHCAQFLIQQHQPVRQRQFRIGADLAIVDMAEAVSILCDDAPACGAKAGVEAQNDHIFPSHLREGLGRACPEDDRGL